MTESQHFLNDLDKKLWTAAEKLRANLDAAVYKHAVLGLIFLKYVSDAFELRQNEVEAQLCDENHDYYLDAADYEADQYEETIREELEVRDYYIEENVFWVSALARWKTIQENAPLPSSTEIEIVNGKKTTYKITSIGKLIDDALDRSLRRSRRGGTRRRPLRRKDGGLPPPVSHSIFSVQFSMRHR